ncbi:unnamed protein product [Linum trigynum]|uniref:Uncharacterized protein n=1 Tax=Linum trigynum TaxID=586398 RepID=A0AAV2G0H7_9ROSI
MSMRIIYSTSSNTICVAPGPHSLTEQRNPRLPVVAIDSPIQVTSTLLLLSLGRRWRWRQRRFKGYTYYTHQWRIQGWANLGPGPALLRIQS